MKTAEEKKQNRAQRNARYHKAAKSRVSTLPVRMDHEQAALLKNAARQSGLSINTYVNLYLLPLAQVIDSYSDKLSDTCTAKGKSLHSILHQALLLYFSQEELPAPCATDFDALFGVEEAG